MGYPGRHNIYTAAIQRMVNEALDAREQEFKTLHESDSDEQLLAYLRTWAHRLHHTPWPGEITGGKMILERFASWEQAVGLAKLPLPSTPNQPNRFVRVQKETERQKIIYRQRKIQKKALSQKRQSQQKAKQQPE